MHWAPLASKEGGPGGGLCVKHKVNSTTIQQLLLAPALFYCTLYNLTVLPIFLHSLGLSTFGLSSFKEFARVIPPQKILKRSPKDPQVNPPREIPPLFSRAHTVGSTLVPKNEERGNSGYLTEKDLLLANTPLLFLKCGRVFLVVAFARVFRKRPEDAHNTLNQRVYFSFRQSRRTFHLHLLYHASQGSSVPNKSFGGRREGGFFSPEILAASFFGRWQGSVSAPANKRHFCHGSPVTNTSLKLF